MVNIIAKSDVGRTRKQNEDNVLVLKNKLEHTLIVVADGMGGHNAGEIASEISCQVIKAEFEKIFQPIDYKEFIESTLLKANKEIYRKSILHAEYAKMGTTTSLLIYDGKRIFIGHIGDSRVYYINETKIMQVTKDHTLVEAMIEAGTLSRREASSSRYKNVLLQALGTSKKLTIDVKELKIPKEFKFLICSDGLTGKVTDEEIKEIVNRETDLESRVDKLINLANEKDGSDNVSVIIIEK